MTNENIDATEAVETEATAHAVDGTPTTTSIGLEENVASAVAYLFGFVSGAILFLMESENRTVRFHGAQSMILSVTLFVLAVGLSLLGIVLSILLTGWLDLVVGLMVSVGWLAFVVVAFLTWIFLLIRSFQGANPRLPVIAGVADGLVK